MHESHEPVTLGSSRSTTFDTRPFRVTAAWFPPGAVLEPHTHDRPIVAFMLDGSFVTSMRGRRLDCRSTTVWSEPCEERHANYVGTAGARVVVIQPNPAVGDTMASFGAVLDEIVCERDPIAATQARKLAVELARPDSQTPLVVDSLVSVLLARAARAPTPRTSAVHAPPWLLRVRDLLHDCFRQQLDLGEIAAGAGITQWHLAREFRRVFRASIGEYARALRVNHALVRLASSSASISEIALDAGFADQSHLTRACQAAVGAPPAVYRRRVQESTGGADRAVAW